MTDYSDGKWIHTEDTNKDGVPFLPVPDDPDTNVLYNQATTNPIDALRHRVQELTAKVFDLEMQRDALVADGQELLREIERLERSDAHGHVREEFRPRLAGLHPDEDYS
ncbi:MAG: hypothetical protein ACYS0H_25635 [Planctomycetota bacterium]|jgi:hypothetical protein